jgi:hypothetical protein
VITDGTPRFQLKAQDRHVQDGGSTGEEAAGTYELLQNVIVIH